MSTWYIIECSRGREAACVALLERFGYPDGWYPSREADARPRGKALRAADPNPRRRLVLAYVPGYIFLPAADLDVYRVNSHEGSLWLRVLAPGGEPYTVSDKDMARMRDVPERVRAMVDEAKLAEWKAKQAKQPVVGGQAMVVEGPFSGRTGTVRSIDAEGVVDLDTGSLLGFVRVPTAIVERVNQNR